MVPFERYRKILAALLPSGLLGASVLLSASAGASERTGVPALEPAASEPPPVALRLAALRDAVSDVTGARAMPEDPRRLAWVNWGNFWPAPIWNNWHNAWNNWNNWHNNWNNWHNNWNNWHNNWNNWRNGWGNW